MALVTLPNPIVWPNTLNLSTGTFGFGTFRQLNGSSTYAAYGFTVTKAGNIAKIAVGVRTVTSSGNIDARVETFDSGAGTPTGTLWGTNTNLQQTISATGLAVFTLTAAAAVSVGDRPTIVFKWVSGDITLGALNSGVSDVPDTTRYPYQRSDSSVSTNITACALMYDDGSIVYVGRIASWPVDTFTTHGLTTSSDPRRYGALCTIPFKCRVWGFRIPIVGTVDFDVTMYDSLNNVLATKTVAASVLGNNSYRSIKSSFTSPPTLDGGTQFRITAVATSATTTTVHALSTLSGWRDAFPGGPIWEATGWNGSAWTDTATEYPLIDLLIDQLDDGASSGSGGPVGTNFRGGFSNG